MNKKFIIPLALMVLVVSSVLASAQLFGTQAAGDSSMRTIAVSGSYTASVAPDQAEFSVTVETQQNTAKAAIEENRRIANGVIEALKAAGVDAKDIQTSGFYVYKKEEYLPYPVERTAPDTISYVPPPGRSQVVGWVASNTITVTTRSLDKVGSLIDLAADAGANSFGGVYFSLSRAKQDELEKQLLEGAAADAKDKAGILAQAFGASLGRVHSISESGTATPIFRAMAADALKSSESAPTPIEPGEVETSRTVSVVFELA